jgi:predicted RNA binding protein YcfA (HicA-like mRNA interferase family)
LASHPRLTAADAETLLVSAGFHYLDRRGHHRIYGRARTRVIVPFDGRPELHPKVVRMIVESMERSRPAVSFEIDKTLVGVGNGTSPALDAAEWPVSDTLAAPAPAEPPPFKGPQAKPPPAPEASAAPGMAEHPVEEEQIDLPRRPRPKAPWS